MPLNSMPFVRLKLNAVTTNYNIIRVLFIVPITVKCPNFASFGLFVTTFH